MVIRAVLDTCVLYPFHLRDFLLEAATMDFAFYVPLWSDGILEELARNHPDSNSKPEKIDRLIAAMSRHFPQAAVKVSEKDLVRARSLFLPDKDDAHVIATAIAANAALIVTDNLNDFPDTQLSKVGVQAIHPGNFVR